VPVPLVAGSLTTTALIGIASGAAAATDTASGGGYFGIAALVSACFVGLGGVITAVTKMVLQLRKVDRIPTTRRGRAKARRDLLRMLAQIDALDGIDDDPAEVEV